MGFLAFLLVLLFGIASGVGGEPMFGNPQNLDAINTPTAETHISLSADGLALYFVSDRFGGQGGADIWVTRRSDASGAWGAPENVGFPINSMNRDLAPCISRDGLTLYFSSDRQPSQGMIDIWVATRSSDASPWNAPVNLGEEVNGIAGENHPFISADSLHLYFSDYDDPTVRKGGLGQLDMWEAKRASVSAAWEKPANMGPVFNTPGRESHPYLSSDGLVFLFCSDRAGGLGQRDIWFSKRATLDGPWSDPRNFGAGVNSTGHEKCVCLSADRSMIYVASDRIGGQGNVDVWCIPVLSPDAFK